VEIFKKTEKTLTPENYQNGLYMSGSCDLRWLDNKPSIVKNIELNGNNLLEVRVTGPKQYISCYYLKNRDKNLIVFSSEIFTDNSTFERINEEIIKILSTLKFASSLTSVSPTANWKTYTNSEYKFTFKYPQEFSFQILDEKVTDKPKVFLRLYQQKNQSYPIIDIILIKTDLTPEQ